MRAPIPLDELTEKEWTGQVVDLAKMLGFKRYHTFHSKHSQGGFPDETLIRERIVFLELKTSTGKPSTLQKEWLMALLNAGGEVYIARPRDWDDLAEILTKRERVHSSLELRTRQELGMDP